VGEASNGALRELIWNSGKFFRRLDFVRNPPFPGQFAPRTLQPAANSSIDLSNPYLAYLPSAHSLRTGGENICAYWNSHEVFAAFYR